MKVSLNFWMNFSEWKNNKFEMKMSKEYVYL